MLKRSPFLCMAFMVVFASAAMNCGASQEDDGQGAAGPVGTGGTGATPGASPGQANIDLPDELTGQTGEDDVSSGAKCGVLHAVVRDFRETQPDFESSLGERESMIKAQLDPDKLPIYAHNETTLIHSKESFHQWYRDVPGVNMRIPVDLEPEQTSPGVFAFEDNKFFPIDNRGFGNEGRSNNYHFITEIRARFTYGGGEKFTFKGDDDVYALPAPTPLMCSTPNAELQFPRGNVDQVPYDSAGAVSKSRPTLPPAKTRGPLNQP